MSYETRPNHEQSAVIVDDTDFVPVNYDRNNLCSPSTLLSIRERKFQSNITGAVTTQLHLNQTIHEITNNMNYKSLHKSILSDKMNSAQVENTKYHRIYRDDGIIALKGEHNLKELQNWLENFQQLINKFTGTSSCNL